MPATGPASRAPRRYANASAKIPPARATASQAAGAAAPSSDRGAVNSTGSGFQEGGPATVSSRRCTISRPHTIQPQGSVVGADGASRDRAPSARHAPSTTGMREVEVAPMRVARADENSGRRLMALSPRGPTFRGAVRTTFVVPAYNEAPTIEEVLRRLDRLGLDKQVIVVDDGSTDATPAILARWAARHPDILVLRKPNGGKGSALRAAIPWIQGDVVVIQDADLEYDPVDVPALIEPIARGRADVVYGSRLVGGRPQRVHLFWHRVGNRALSLLTDILFNTTLSDMESGYKAFRADVLTSLTLTEDGFGIEPEITAAVCRGGLRIYELPVSYYGRSYAEGKKITWRDGLTAVRVLLRARLRSRGRHEQPHAQALLAEPALLELAHDVRRPVQRRRPAGGRGAAGGRRQRRLHVPLATADDDLRAGQ